MIQINPEACNIRVKLDDGHVEARTYVFFEDAERKIVICPGGIRRNILEDNITICPGQRLHVKCQGRGDAGAVHGIVRSVEIIKI